MDVQVSTEVDRPVAEVWRFYAIEHVRNHPRWDPDMHLEQVSDGPIRLFLVLDDLDEGREPGAHIQEWMPSGSSNRAPAGDPWQGEEWEIRDGWRPGSGGLTRIRQRL